MSNFEYKIPLSPLTVQTLKYFSSGACASEKKAIGF